MMKRKCNSVVAVAILVVTTLELGESGCSKTK